MTARNVLFIMSDQHQQKVTGCYGHDFIKTPHIDALAARGTRFTTAYTNSAICVPARAALATGRYVNETHYWDNSHGYEGRVKSWHQLSGEQGAGVTAIGKLHYRSDKDPTGFEAMPKMSDPEVPLHPWIHLLQRSRNHEDFLTPATKKILMNSYYGCVSYLDSNIGKVIAALDAAGLRDDTLIIYTTDHGENLGARRLWGKNNMYEESAAIPMIVAGPGVPEGKISTTPVTLIDIGPTVLDTIGHNEITARETLPGQSLIQLANAAPDPERVAFSEYYAAGADRASFMIRKGKYKFITYVGYEPELFDLENDPEELRNLAKDAAYAAIVGEYDRILRGRVDPEALDELAFRDQSALVEKSGGREKVTAKGAIQGSPVPGERAEYVA